MKLVCSYEPFVPGIWTSLRISTDDIIESTVREGYRLSYVTCVLFPPYIRVQKLDLVGSDNKTRVFRKESAFSRSLMGKLSIRGVCARQRDEHSDVLLDADVTFYRSYYPCMWYDGG